MGANFVPKNRLWNGVLLSQQMEVIVRASRATLPSYDRAALSPGIVHIGVGAFHRAHQQVYLDQLAHQGISSEWGVVGAGLRGATQRTALLRQDCLYSVLDRAPDGDSARIVGTLLDYLHGPGDRASVLAALTDPRTKIVSLTVTGDGYGLDGNGELDCLAADVKRDLAHPWAPASVPGYLTEALRRRRDAGIEPFTVLSCDNVPQNGRMARTAVLSFASLREERLAAWIERNVSFPQTVVDRITPQATVEHRRVLADEFGIGDRCPVVCEDFSQWIVEDDFCNGRPPLEEVGVQFVADVTPHELHKKRLLNGTHCALGYLGYLSGHRRIDEALADPLLRGYAETLMADEVGPLLPRTLGIDPAGYRQTLLSRFANPQIGDRLQRLCQRGSTKMPAYLLPSLTEALAQGRPHEGLTLAVAAWARYLQGVDFEGRSIEVRDRRAETLQPLAREAARDPRALLGVTEVFGELGEDADFAAELGSTLRLLEARGVAATLEARLGERLAVAA
jgi:fructuronate reductase/mannitol 2-dehydrogenase